MLRSIALPLLSVFTLLNARSANKKCARELQATLYEPQTYARDYLVKVATAFNTKKPFLFTSQADSYIQSFEQKWGVTVAVKDAFNICSRDLGADCNSTTIAPTPLGSAVYTFNITDDVIITSLSINVTGNSGGNSGLGAYNLTSPAGTLIQLSSTNICAGNSNGTIPFTIGFSDSSSLTDITCPAQQNEGLILTPTQPLSTFNGESTQGTWTLVANNGGEIVISLITLNYCAGSGAFCPRDVMKSTIGAPGFRYDAGTQSVYYTEDVFDAFGNFKQITFSRPISGLSL